MFTWASGFRHPPRDPLAPVAPAADTVESGQRSRMTPPPASPDPQRTTPAQPPSIAASAPASRGRVPDLAVGARRFAVTAVTLSAVAYLLGWFSPLDHLITGLMLLGGL